MKCRLFTYTHESNGISVEVIPETEDEQMLLDALWRFGRMDTGHSSSNPRAKMYCVNAFRANTASETEAT